MEIGTFYDKLNKVDGNIYVIEEEINLTNGAYEGELEHDNISESTLAVYTGKKLTGTKIDNYTLLTPSLAPWKRIIRIYADVPTVYVSYETTGDTVEADDINRVQDEIVKAQKALNAECDRAESVENELNEGLQKEVSRSKSAENVLNNELQAEIGRASAAEQTISGNLEAETARASDAEAVIKSIIDGNRQNWEDKYTRNEIDNKFSALETAIDWKEAVETYDDLHVAYPDPQDGWTVNVKDTAYTYRWNGTEWVAISANSIPKATQETDGLLSKEDKTAYDDTNAKKHLHENLLVLNKITQVLLDAWNQASEKAHDHVNKSVIDVISKEDVDKWDTVTDKVDKETGKALSTNDFTNALLGKLNGIASGAQVNVQADYKVEDSTSDAYIKNKPAKVVHYGVCNTEAGTAAKIVSCENFVLETGAHIRVKFTVTNSAANMTLNVNGTGEKEIKYHGDTLNAEYLSAKRIIEFVYDGTNWEVVGDFDTNTKYSEFKGAAADMAGKSGLVPAPESGKTGLFLCSDGEWKEPPKDTNTYVPTGATWNDIKGV